MSDTETYGGFRPAIKPISYNGFAFFKQDGSTVKSISANFNGISFGEVYGSKKEAEAAAKEWLYEQVQAGKLTVSLPEPVLEKQKSLLAENPRSMAIGGPIMKPKCPQCGQVHEFGEVIAFFEQHGYSYKCWNCNAAFSRAVDFVEPEPSTKPLL